MKTENKSALLGLVGGIGMTIGVNVLRTPEAIENHIAPDTVYVSPSVNRTEDSLTILSLTTTLNEKDSIIESAPTRTVYVQRKAAAPSDDVRDAADNVFTALADSTQ